MSQSNPAQMGRKKTVLITGASRGIGYMAAQVLADEGYNVVGWSRKKPASFPGTWMQCDVSDAEAVKARVSEVIAEWGIDCLLNNVALPSKDKFGEISQAQLLDSLEFHGRVCLQMMQAATPGMIEHRWGRIVNILSTTLTGYTERTCYRAGKEVVKSLTVSAALELAHAGITVNGVAPGPIATDTFYGANPPGSKGEQYWISLVPMQRFGTEKEITAAIKFFFSEEASFVTGQILYVDGGMSVGRVIDV